jgi:integrase
VFWVGRKALDACPRCGGELITSEERKQEWSTHATRREAQAALGDKLTAIGRGSYVEPSKQTVGAYLAEWLDGRSVRPSTLASYRHCVSRHVPEAMSATRLDRLTPEALESLYRKMRDTGLSGRTCAYVHTILRKALADAVRRGRLTRNVADLVERPKASSPEMRTWTAEELGRFLEHVRGERLYAAWTLAATTGLRRGEVLGLRWADVDLDAARVAVRQTLISVEYGVQLSEPKTAKGRRSVALDPQTVAILREHRKHQVEERLAWGPAYHPSELVFTREDGFHIHPERFSDMFEARVRRAGLPRIRLHDLRHTHATLALAAGVHPKVVSERLGHANIGITLDTYSHAIPALEEEAAATVAALVFQRS